MTCPDDEQWVEVGDYRFFVRCWNRTIVSEAFSSSDASEQNASEQCPVIWLHGFMGSGEDWDEVIQRWGDRPPCLTLDLPGHGHTLVTGPDDYYSMHHTAQGILQLLDSLQIHHCSLVGYSMGGRLALYLALHSPERFRWVVLESASPGLKTAEERRMRRERDAALAHTLSTTHFNQTEFNQFLNAWYQQPLFASQNQHPSFPALLDRRLRNQPKELGRSLLHMGTGQQPSFWESLSSSPTPILHIVGEHDSKYRRIATDMGDRHPHYTHAIVPNCGHTVHLEQPDLFLNHLTALCKSIK